MNYISSEATGFKNWHFSPWIWHPCTATSWRCSCIIRVN